MDGSSKGDGIYARRHDLGSTKSVQYAFVLVFDSFYIRLVAVSSSLFNHPFLLQLDVVHKLVLRNLVFLRRFFQRPSRKKGLGQSE